VIVFAQLSDTHLDGGPQRARRARAVMQYLRTGRGPLDAVLVTGDIADSGRPREYQQAREILTAACPVLCTLGNHDARGRSAGSCSVIRATGAWGTGPST
jgi:3',5'-cyclic-AMP phosphodiesterase